MPNNLTESVSPESLERKHDVSDQRVRNVLIIGGGAAFLIILSLIVCGVVIYEFAQLRPMQNMRPLGLIQAPDLKPLERFPKPDLQIDDDHQERTALLTAQKWQLMSYAWIDRSNGIVRIPIDRAMTLLAQRGLPTRTNGISQTDGSSLQLRQERAQTR